MRYLIERFWAWYDKFYRLNLNVTAGLFLLQLAHLYWLTTHVVLFRLFGIDYFFTHSPFVTFLIVLADYTEIPAFVAASVLYIRQIKQEGAGFKNILFLILINSQWVHLFWITDEVVLSVFGLGDVAVPLNPFVAWIAIAIDYLELPVILDTLREAMKTHSLKSALEVMRSKD